MDRFSRGRIPGPVSLNLTTIFRSLARCVVSMVRVPPPDVSMASAALGNQVHKDLLELVFPIPRTWEASLENRFLHLDIADLEQIGIQKQGLFYQPV